jgi:alpha-D-xyloside xylohydrolase
MGLAEAAHRTGAPVMRPLFFDFPDDEAARGVDDQFMFGPDVLVAPVTTAGMRSRAVYLPSGTRWVERVTGTVHEGGTRVEASAPLERIPVYRREVATKVWNAEGQ